MPTAVFLSLAPLCRHPNTHPNPLQNSLGARVPVYMLEEREKKERSEKERGIESESQREIQREGEEREREREKERKIKKE